MDNVRCPGCGKDMCVRKYKSVSAGFPYSESYRAECSCGWAGPWRDTEGEALTAAMQRYQPENRVLTLEEVTGSDEPCVYLEMKQVRSVYACDCVVACDGKNADIATIGTTIRGKRDMRRYGADWRCWLRRPTDAEREAVKWG